MLLAWRTSGRREIGSAGVVKWGRNAEPGSGTAGSHDGRRSILLALGALTLVVAALAFMVGLPTGTAEPWPTIATFAVAASYFLVAPLLHLAGLVFGIRGLVRGGERRLPCVFGILLNVGLVVAGVLVLMAVLPAMGAFT